ncbi:hypothetical protein F4820DRAFT_447595 [Hypoxylon rubiginosum]|uniref:Uncharacterized protein n=1 Tax=Hypoxylon rubiginosum TaxID=110542 RepID=A0ACB9Z381_9PEZI|nr:hypothetical protein F4820DRAFT_447595 [Hypoxylon rubiginosum]
MSYFRPSSQALNRGRARESRSTETSKYLGDTSLPDNSGLYVPVSKTVNLWVSNIPPGITHHEFLGFIRGSGKVRSLVLYKPVGKHKTAAAALSFFRHDRARKFIENCTSGEITMHDKAIWATWNRHRVAEPEDDSVSRVLIIEGCAKFVNRQYLDEFLPSKVFYDIDEIIEHKGKQGDNGERAKIEYRFASCRGQAVLALIALRKEHWHQSLTVEYGKDPCEESDAVNGYSPDNHLISPALN